MPETILDTECSNEQNNRVPILKSENKKINLQHANWS